MARRSLFKTLKRMPDGIPNEYDIGMSDAITLNEIAKEKDGLWRVIGWCLAYGYVAGHDATIKGTYREAKQKTASMGVADGLQTTSKS